MMTRFGLLVCVVGLLMYLPGVALAQTATPGALPTPTSIYTRPTPTPWQVTPDSDPLGDFSFANNPGEIADSAINGYNFVNRDGLLDYVIFIILSMVIVGMLTRLIRSGKEL